MAISLSSSLPIFSASRLIAIPKAIPLQTFTGIAAVWEGYATASKLRPRFIGFRGLEGKGDWGGQNSPTDISAIEDSRYTQEFDSKLVFWQTASDMRIAIIVPCSKLSMQGSETKQSKSCYLSSFITRINEVRHSSLEREERSKYPLWPIFFF